MTLRAFIDGISVVGPGFTDWPVAEAVLAGRAAYVPAPTIVPVPQSLPPAERRRAGRIVSLAIATGAEAAQQAGLAVISLAAVFASSGADGDVCHEICQTLASADRQVSPTRFHNSVHNVPAGYWSIATRSMEPSTTLCAYDASFAAGLLEALVQVVTLNRAVLLISCDATYPPPLREKRPILDSFGIAIALVPEKSVRSMARLSVQIERGQADTMADTGLEQLRTGTPAGRALPLLALLARRATGVVAIDYLDAMSLRGELLPC